MPDVALRRDDFQPQTKLTRVAKPHHLGTACVGAQITANGAGAFGSQAQWEKQVGGLRVVLQVLQDATRLHRHGEVGSVQRANGVHALQAQHNLVARVVGSSAHDQTGVAALGHDAQWRVWVKRTVSGAGLDDLGDFICAGRAYHGQRLAARALAPVLFPSCQVAIGQYMDGAHDVADFVQQGLHGLSFL